MHRGSASCFAEHIQLKGMACGFGRCWGAQCTREAAIMWVKAFSAGGTGGGAAGSCVDVVTSSFMSRHGMSPPVPRYLTTSIFSAASIGISNTVPSLAVAISANANSNKRTNQGRIISITMHGIEPKSLGAIAPMHIPPLK